MSWLLRRDKILMGEGKSQRNGGCRECNDCSGALLLKSERRDAVVSRVCYGEERSCFFLKGSRAGSRILHCWN